MIEVNEYVRTDKGYIFKVDEEKKNLQIANFWDVEYGKIVNHSKQLIDLIEVGDYVNGELITDKWDTRISSIRSNFSEEEIKTILTKESYMANCYKVGGEDGIKTTYRRDI